MVLHYISVIVEVTCYCEGKGLEIDTCLNYSENCVCHAWVIDDKQGESSISRLYSRGMGVETPSPLLRSSDLSSCTKMFWSRMENNFK